MSNRKKAAGVPTGRYIPAAKGTSLVQIRQQPDLYLACSKETAGRYAKCWQAAWQTVPPKAQELILEYWRSNPLCASIVPSVCAYEDVPPLIGPQNGDAMAWTTDHGFTMFFCESSMNLLSDQVVTTIFGRELGHVCQHVLSRCSGTGCDPELDPARWAPAWDVLSFVRAADDNYRQRQGLSRRSGGGRRHRRRFSSR